MPRFESHRGRRHPPSVTARVGGCEGTEGTVATRQPGATMDCNDGGVVEQLAKRLTLLDALAGLAQVTAQSHDSATALDGFSAAVQPLIPHDWVNVAWLEEDQHHFHWIGAMVHQGESPRAECQEGNVATSG